MKKLIYLLPLLALIAVLGVGNVQSVQASQTVQYPAELAYYDAQINLLLPRLDDFQYQYHTVNGRYYQALASHATAPDVPEVPDALSQSPTDQPETLAFFWHDIAELPEVLAWSFRIDTYSGPDGDGYVLTAETIVNSETWMRSVNYGPDTWRAADWYLVTPEE